MASFDKHTDFIVHSESPFNGGPPTDLLRKAFITPQELFFARNHAAIPKVDPAKYRLVIDGLVREPLALSLDEIYKKFAKQTLVATLQCAGNRRSELSTIAPIPGELTWGAEAIGNVVWGGVRLSQVLAAAGVSENTRYVAFTGLDQVETHGDRSGFGGSIPTDKAMSAEVLLAYEMNGESLLPLHGFPLRVVTPGYIGARSVKWLSHIALQATPSDNYFQSHAYQLFPPHISAETADWSKGIQLGEIPVNAVICCPANGERVKPNGLLVQGYAIANGDRPLTRVEVSGDGGETWVDASLATEEYPWAWRFWQARLDLKPGTSQIVVRAFDSAGNTQPEDAKTIWNFKGYMNNAWHRVNIHVEPA